ncbi:helix-turn-helix domain-containing protein [Sciscionella sediminilitoris]|uniref:helix-turn-helix domain-containing protein n=1 Tax=Sciscionella sediminilitoris TaxID=1445613 RepID=UPI0004DEDD05|nr:XRE family transcriptional regulator [Sciscionella sp. SE31]
MTAAIRVHRLESGMTLDQLAAAAGVTKSYLSKIERGISSPSIAIAMRIAEALQVDAAEIFAAPEESTEAMVVERGEGRTTVPATAGAPVYSAIAASLPGKHMHPFRVHPTEDEDGPLVQHAGQEFLYVVTGTVEVTVDGETSRLGPGDTAYFDATRRHRLRSLSPGAERASVLLVTTIDRHPPD